MAAERRNATVAAVRMAGQTADILRDLTAGRPMGDRVEAAEVEAAVLRIAGPVAVAAEAAGLAVAAVVRAEEAVALRIRLRHTVAVAAEGPTSKSIGLWASPSPSPSVPRVSVRRLRRD